MEDDRIYLEFEDGDRTVLTGYLEDCAIGRKEEVRKLVRGTNMVALKERSVYKYKPVDKKVKLVIQELPAEFRIKREIKGNPLAEMLKLTPNPPEFKPMGQC